MRGGATKRAVPMAVPVGRRKEKSMSFLNILTKILTIAPAGIQLTQEVVTLIQAIEGAFAVSQTPPQHQEAVVSALGAHLAKQ